VQEFDLFAAWFNRVNNGIKQGKCFREIEEWEFMGVFSWQ
jgi:hypothetical protein